jgi:hypothetical protein
LENSTSSKDSWKIINELLNKKSKDYLYKWTYN